MAAESSRIASPSSKPRRTYDVFLSFRGEDTRYNFIDHLYAALIRKGFLVFKDDEKLERGNSISEKLFKAICESEYAIVVISQQYASSKWCLKELAKIVECKKKGWLKVLPIFYHVDPSNVRKHEGIFSVAFSKLVTAQIDEEQLNVWRDALEEVANLAGWDARNRPESKILEEICTEIGSGLSRKLPNISKNLFGIESRVHDMMTLLCMESEEVRFVGICAMGGAGKTTLAEAIFDTVSFRFDSSCFIADVRESSRNLVGLQQQILYEILKEDRKFFRICEGAKEIASRLRTKRVFIVLDDLDEEEQFEALAREHNWFGLGSRILVTSRDECLLKKYVDEIYDIRGLEFNDALQLFSWNAFRKTYPEECYEVMSRNIVNYAKGLPLALKVFGSFLFKASIDAWESVLGRIKKNPNAKILDRLRISYDGLEKLQQELFLDIACFFKGEFIDNVLSKLKALGHFSIDIDVLVSKSLVEVSHYGKFEMHDLLQEMGHQIVYQESPYKPGMRSRLWHHEDILFVLNNNTGTSAVKGIVIKLPLSRSLVLSFEQFSSMTNLRMLVISRKTEFGIPFSSKYRHEPIMTNFVPKKVLWYASSDHEISRDLKTVKWCGDPSELILSNHLCFIEWWGYPLKFLPTSFQPSNLVELIMPWSSIEILWKEKKSFDKLEHINLMQSERLNQAPDFNGLPNLEIFDATRTAITRLPSFGGSSKKLKVLRIRSDCSNPIGLSFPNSLSGLSCLAELYLGYCNLLDGAFPSDLSCLPSLKELNLSGNKFTKIPDNLFQLSNLSNLILDDCSRLRTLSKLPVGLDIVSTSNCPSLDVLYWSVDFLTSSEMLVGGDFAFQGFYYGCDAQSYKTIHRFQPRGVASDRDVDEWRYSISWGPTLGSEIPLWFIYRSISRTVQFHMDYGSAIHFTESKSGIESSAERFVSLVLFIVYEVHKPDSCQSKGKKARLDELGNSCTREPDDGNGHVSPAFVCKLEERHIYNFAFRIPEVPSIGPSGVWLLIKLNPFVASFSYHPFKWYKELSLEISSPNVELKEYGARLVSDVELPECYEILNTISPHGFDPKSFTKGEELELLGRIFRH